MFTFALYYLLPIKIYKLIEKDFKLIIGIVQYLNFMLISKGNFIYDTRVYVECCTRYV